MRRVYEARYEARYEVRYERPYPRIIQTYSRRYVHMGCPGDARGDAQVT
jgi:hypothetical protein